MAGVECAAEPDDAGSVAAARPFFWWRRNTKTFVRLLGAHFTGGLVQINLWPSTTSRCVKHPFELNSFRVAIQLQLRRRHIWSDELGNDSSYSWAGSLFVRDSPQTVAVQAF